MTSGFLFSCTRILQILTLIPIWGILAWFVDAYQPTIPPVKILLLFIVALLATVWAFFTLTIYWRIRWTPLYIAIIDLCFFALFVASVVILAPSVVNTNCINWSGQGVGWSDGTGTIRSGNVTADKQCMMLKSAWGLGIVDTILFFATAVLAWHFWNHTMAVGHERRPSRRLRRSKW